MTSDAGDRKIARLLEEPSTELESAMGALVAALETLHGDGSGTVKLPPSLLGPIGRLQNYYHGLHRQIDITESGNGAARDEAERGLARMEEGLKAFASAVHMEGTEAAQEAKIAAAEIGKAGGEINRAIGRLG